MYKRTAEVCNDAATTAVATNLSHPLLFIRAENVTTGELQQKDRSFVLRETEELLCWWLRTPNAMATPCTKIKFSFFFFSFWRQMNMAAQHCTWQYANYKFYRPPTRNIVFFFFLSKCILHMYTHTNKSSCDLPSPPISKKEKLLGGKKEKETRVGPYSTPHFKSLSTITRSAKRKKKAPHTCLQRTLKEAMHPTMHKSARPAHNTQHYSSSSLCMAPYNAASSRLQLTGCNKHWGYTNKTKMKRTEAKESL